MDFNGASVKIHIISDKYRGYSFHFLKTEISFQFSIFGIPISFSYVFYVCVHLSTNDTHNLLYAHAAAMTLNRRR